MTYLIAPSILSADITNLGGEIQHIIDAGCSIIHLDVMDNHYVPNLTFGPFVGEQLLKRFPALELDVHLMVQNPDNLIHAFSKIGAKRIAIHPDSTTHVDRSLQLIQDLGCQSGLVLNPATIPETIAWCKHRIDFVLIMLVNPGFGGQALIPAMIEKIKWVNRHYPDLPICVDGGVSLINIKQLAQAGASQFVAGSAIFGSDDYATTLTALRNELENA